MNVACTNCPARYAVPDDKVRGKKARITCKRCGTTIIVDGTQLGSAPSGIAASPAVVVAPRSPETDGEWLIAMSDRHQESANIERVVDLFSRGLIGSKTYLWREGMPEWKTPLHIPEVLEALAQRGIELNRPSAPAEHPYIAQQEEPTHVVSPPSEQQRPEPEFETPRMPLESSIPRMGPPPDEDGDTRIREPLRSLIDASELPADMAEAAAAPPAAEPRRFAPPAPRRSVGRATLPPMGAGPWFAGRANAGSAPRPRPSSVPSEAFSLHQVLRTDPRSSPPPRRTSNSPEPMTVTPAGVPSRVEPATLSAGDASAAQHILGSRAEPVPRSHAPTSLTFEPVPKRRNRALIPAVVAGVLGVGALVVGLLTSGKRMPPPGEPAGAVAATPTLAPEPAPASPAATPAESAAPALAVSALPPVAQPRAAWIPRARPAAARGASARGAAASDQSDAEESAGIEAAVRAEIERESASEAAGQSTADPGGASPFNREAASEALWSAAAGAQTCAAIGGPTGAGQATVTFAPTGKVTSVIVGGQFKGTAVGGCLASLFQAATVPAFDGEPVTVAKRFSID